MTEYSPSSSERPHQPESDQFIDMIQEPAWVQYCEKAAEAEAAMVIYDPNEEGVHELAAMRALDLDEALGYEYGNEPCQVAGLGYFINPQAGVSRNLTFIDTDSAVFQSTGIHYLHGKWRTMMEVYVREHTDKLSSGTYYIPPNQYHIRELKIAPPGDKFNDDDDEVTLESLFEEQVIGARRQVRSKDFAEISPEEQRFVLHGIISSADSYLPREYRDRNDVIVTCAEYYTVCDGMPDLDLRDLHVDQSAQPVKQRQALIGELMGYAYPELEALPEDTPLDYRNLRGNGGAPCIVLRNEELRVEYYIVPQTVTDISTLHD